MKLKVFLLVTLVVLCICSIAFAQEPPPEEEEITLTTYYPAPYGEYDKLYVDSWIRLDRTGLNTGELRFAAPDVTGSNTTLWNFHNRGPDFGAGAIPGGDGNKLYITYYDGTSWSGPHMVVTPSGDVGIGETDPQAKLHIGGTAGTDGIMFPDGTLQTTAGGFGVWNDRDKDGVADTVTFDTVYQASTDGFVCAWVEALGGWPMLEGYTDSNPNPTTLRVVHQITDTGGDWGEITMPVRKGDYWRVNQIDDRCNRSIYWLPMGD